MAPSTRSIKLDPACLAAVDLARTAAEETAGVMGVGDHLGAQADDDRVVSHFFACPHPGYRGWRWSVTVVRASRAKIITINEVVLLPGDEALLASDWVPWAERIQPGDVTPGLLMPSAGDDPRLEPGFSGGESAADSDPAEQSLMRSVVAELGLGRERVLSAIGRDEATERWLAGDSGPDNQLTKLAPASVRPAGSSFGSAARWGCGSVRAPTCTPPPTPWWSVLIMAAARIRVWWPKIGPRSCRQRFGKPSSGTRSSRCSTDPPGRM